MTKYEEEAVELIGKIFRNDVISESVADIVALIKKVHHRALLAASEAPLIDAPDHELEKGTAAHLRTQIRRCAAESLGGGA